MGVLFANSAKSKLAANLSSGATLLAIDEDDAWKFPSPAGGDWFPLTLFDAAGNIEYVKCTGRAAAILTIVRAQEGTTAKTFLAGSGVSHRLTAAALQAMRDTQSTELDAAVATLEDSISDVSNAVGTLSSHVDSVVGAPPEDLNSIEKLADAVDELQVSTIAALDAIASIDPWSMQPVGSIIAIDSGEELDPPPTDKAYRYIDLTAGLTGAGGYNNGVLTSESVSGSAPNITATAIVSLSGSPLNGKTIRLLNTERRFLRPGSAGTLEDSQNLAHNHGGATSSGGDHTHTTGATIGGSGSVNPSGGSSGFSLSGRGSTSSAGAHSQTISNDGGSEARPRSIGVKYFRRVK